MAASISKSLSRNLKQIHKSTILANWAPSSSFSTEAISQSQKTQGKERSTLAKLLLFVPGAITFGLGTWQVFRRQEKMKVLEYTRDRVHGDPLKCNEIVPTSENLESSEFRRIVCRGIFDEDNSIYVGPRSRSISGVTENGYYLITPLMPNPRDPESIQLPILVNRGWVPRSWRDKSIEASENSMKPSNISTTPKQETAKGSWLSFWSRKPKDNEDQVAAASSVEVLGVIRGSERPSIFVPANDLGSFQWFYVDVPAMARSCGLPENALYIEDINENINPSNPYPLPKDPNKLVSSSVMPQDHLNYMLTWYSLSAAVTYMAFKRLKPQKIRR
ncbi:chaperone [Lithospermum erythrorhizon]|uniref:SURF1-like protein n=1 Tax=Lithospermum erythrorhizon TaxID=34254 RepID=A0AAV3QCN6_LITER